MYDLEYLIQFGLLKIEIITRPVQLNFKNKISYFIQISDDNPTMYSYINKLNTSPDKRKDIMNRLNKHYHSIDDLLTNSTAQLIRVFVSSIELKNEMDIFKLISTGIKNIIREYPHGSLVYNLFEKMAHNIHSVENSLYNQYFNDITVPLSRRISYHTILKLSHEFIRIPIIDYSKSYNEINKAIDQLFTQNIIIIDYDKNVFPLLLKDRLSYYTNMQQVKYFYLPIINNAFRIYNIQEMSLTYIKSLEYDTSDRHINKKINKLDDYEEESLIEFGVYDKNYHRKRIKNDQILVTTLEESLHHGHIKHLKKNLFELLLSQPEIINKHFKKDNKTTLNDIFQQGRLINKNNSIIKEYVIEKKNELTENEIEQQHRQNNSLLSFNSSPLSSPSSPPSPSPPLLNLFSTKYSIQQDYDTTIQKEYDTTLSDLIGKKRKRIETQELTTEYYDNDLELPIRKFRFKLLKPEKTKYDDIIRSYTQMIDPNSPKLINGETKEQFFKDIELQDKLIELSKEIIEIERTIEYIANNRKDVIRNYNKTNLSMIIQDSDYIDMYEEYDNFIPSQNTKQKIQQYITVPMKPILNESDSEDTDGPDEIDLINYYKTRTTYENTLERYIEKYSTNNILDKVDKLLAIKKNEINKEENNNSSLFDKF